MLKVGLAHIQNYIIAFLEFFEAGIMQKIYVMQTASSVKHSPDNIFIAQSGLLPLKCGLGRVLKYGRMRWWGFSFV